jgi:hypothetical protein
MSTASVRAIQQMITHPDRVEPGVFDEATHPGQFRPSDLTFHFWELDAYLHATPA